MNARAGASGCGGLSGVGRAVGLDRKTHPVQGIGDRGSAKFTAKTVMSAGKQQERESERVFAFST